MNQESYNHCESLLRGRKNRNKGNNEETGI